MMTRNWRQWLWMASNQTTRASRRKRPFVGLANLECLEPKTLLTTPVVVNGNGNTTEGNALVGSVSGLGTDVDGDNLTYSTVATAKHGILQFNSDGSFTYTPNSNYSGSDSFTFRANDGTSNSNTGTFNITINNVDNDAPTVVGASHDVMKNVAFDSSVATLGSDPENTALTYSAVDMPTKGMLTLNADGSFTYTPGLDETGADSFTFQASDGVNFSGLAVYSLNLIDNNVPTLIAGFANPNEDLAFPGSVLPFATDLDGDTLTFSVVTQPTHGTLSLASSGTYTYTPDADYSGPDSFTYKANDGLIDSADGTVTINVAEVNDPLTLTFPSGTTQIARNSSPVRIDPAATVADVDESVDFANAQIRALVSSGNTNGDYQKGRIALKVLSQGNGPGLVYVVGSKIYFNGDAVNPIATFTGGTLGRALVIKFRSTATAAGANAVLRQISLVASKKASSFLDSNNELGVRLIDVTVSAGGQKVLATKKVSVI